MHYAEIKMLIQLLLKTLKGDWVLIGGAVPVILGVSKRQTFDIDIVPIGTITNQETMQLVDVSIKAGYPAGTFNTASEYFLKKIKNWEKNTLLLGKGKKCRIYRPNKWLFRELKKRRGTETDLLDIELMEKSVDE